MIPAISMGPGCQLWYYKGQQVVPFNLSLIGQRADVNTWQNLSATDGAISNFFGKLFAGAATFYPFAYANHKSIAIRDGKVYYGSVDAGNPNSDVKAFRIFRFDGSGLFVNQGAVGVSAQYSTVPAKNGRGSEFLSPSGNVSTNPSHDYICVNYNNTIYFVTAVRQSTNDYGSWRNNEPFWIGSDDGITSVDSDVERAYKLFQIEQNLVKRLHPTVRFKPDVTRQAHLSFCDAIGFKGSLWVSTWSDIFFYKLSEGSGIPTPFLFDSKSPSAKAFAIWPSGGLSNGKSLGDDRLLILDGSGLVRRIRHLDAASGIKTDNLVNLGIFGGKTGRTGDNHNARLLGTTTQPGRSVVFQPFNEQLHAFIPTATSGYRHLVCIGNPSGTTDWRERTSFMPREITSYDGNVFAYVDNIKNRLIIKHTTMGEIGLYGQRGAMRAAGADSIWAMDTQFGWAKMGESILDDPSRSFIPYQNFGPNVQIPSGMLTPSGSNPVIHKCNDYAILEYTLLDQFARNVNVSIEYSVNNGLSWNTARRFKSYETILPLGSGTQDLATSPQGITYDFYWDYVNDVGFNKAFNALLRIRPKLIK